MRISSITAPIAFTVIGCSLLGDSARDERVRQDLSYVVDQITNRHPSPFTRISRDEFGRQRQNLSDSIPSLSDLEAYLRIQALVASIGDAHTSLSLDDKFYRVFGLRHFPVRCTLYDDGLFLSATDERYTRYLGRRIVSINGRTPGETADAVRPFVSYDNEQWLRQQFAAMLRSPQLLQGLGLAENPDRCIWTVEDLLGNRESLILEGVDSAPGAALINDPAVGYLSPTYLDPSLNYWYRYYPEQKLLFFEYNICAERRDLPFSAFAANLLNDLDSKPADYLIVDLRDNAGGNSEVWRPFLNGLQTRYIRLRQNPRFGFYGLISRLTFSSGMLAAEEIKRFEGALLAGEDTGGNPDSFGDVASYPLPNSGIAGSVSTKHFTPFAPGVKAPSVAADIRVYRDSADVFARFDPILFKVFSLKDSLESTRPENRSSPVVSAASFRAGSPQAPNSLTTVFGNFEGATTAVASSLPLPDTLNDVQVFTGGRPAPLLFVSPNQINFQQPSGALLADETVEVRRAGRVIWTGTESTAPAAPAIFVSDAAHLRRPGAVLNEDGTLNSPEHPAHTRQILQIFGTGYPELTTPLAAGTVPPRGDLARTRRTPTLWIGQWEMEVLFSGASPEFPGVWQINARIPDVAETKKLMPVSILSEGRLSNAVTVWVE